MMCHYSTIHRRNDGTSNIKLSMKQNYIFFLLLFSLVACTNTQNKKQTTEIKQEYEIIYSDSKKHIGRIERIYCYDSCLIVGHSEADKNYSFLNKNNGKIINEWGTVGKGPNEFLTFGTQNCIVDSTLFFMDNMSHKIVSVSINDIINKRDSIQIVKENIPYSDSFFPLSLCVMKDCYAFMGCYTKTRFGLTNRKMKIINHSVFDYPFSTKNIQEMERGRIFQGMTFANPDGNKMAIITFASDVLEIYDFYQEMPELANINKFQYFPQTKDFGGARYIDSKKSIAGFFDITATNDYIYILSSESTYKDFLTIDDHMSNNIGCFDWNGNKISNIKLPVSVSTISTDGRYIYGAGFENENNVIYKIKI